jgi:putative ABC transport system permease protein
MLINYFKITLRTLVRQKGFAAINLVGLALGLSSGILIMIYVLDEMSFDKFHSKADRILRVGTDMVDIKTGNPNGSIETNGWPIGKLLEKDFPEVEKVVYIANASNLQINHEGKRFDERLFYAGDAFFSMFDFSLTKGDPATALSKPFSVVLTESAKKKYFGDQDALGKTLTLADSLLFQVTGVMKDVPRQSHMQFSMLVSFATYETRNSGFSYDDGWGNLNVRNYILLKEGVNRQGLITKAENLYMDYVKEEMKNWGMFMYVRFESLNDIYLNTKRGNGMGPVGSMDRLYIVSGIAIFVILLACINFINLATARSAHRAKEVGLRKVVGSSRKSLINQFLSESFLLTMLSLIVAVGLLGLALPFFNVMLNKDYDLTWLTDWRVVSGVALLVIVISFLSGYYPALVISSLRPSEVLKGKLTTSHRGIQLRRFLVIFQFSISTGLIICTFTILRQLDFMLNRDLGFTGRQILVLDADKVTDRGGFGSSAESTSPFKNELQSLSSVEAVTFTNAVPGRPGWMGQWAFATDRTDDGSIGMEYMAIDEDYLKTLGLSLVAGRNFELDRPSEIQDGLIINETAALKLGWGAAEHAIGKKIDSPSKHPAGTVIGVVKDYHELGLQQLIYPMAMDYNPARSRYYAIRFKTTGTSDFLNDLQALWKKHYDGYDFKYFFLDENFARQYQAEQRLANLFTAFSVITIVIAMMGLVGLISFMVTARKKEIGIRKVLGSSVAGITQLLSKEFVRLVIIAVAIATPLTWYLMNSWLAKFAYRTDPNVWMYLWAGVITLGIALLTVSFQSIKAALSNPIDSLRNE